jgi:hypothetical protein
VLLFESQNDALYVRIVVLFMSKAIYPNSVLVSHKEEAKQISNAKFISLIDQYLSIPNPMI